MQPDYTDGTGRSPGSVFRSEDVLMRGLPLAAMGVAVAALIAGCDGSSSKSMTVDGPNQVIFNVPSMT